jgi:Tfp pilus assembly protein PilO
MKLQQCTENLRISGIKVAELPRIVEMHSLTATQAAEYVIKAIDVQTAGIVTA